MIKLMVNRVEVPYEITRFPDGTSQVWKVSQRLYEDDDIKILWLFENEAELFHLCQLAQLVQKISGQEDTELIAPYLPYGRQDKMVSNETSFALDTFTQMVYNFNVCRIETFDAHSKFTANTYIHSVDPTAFHKSIFNHDVVCFPDKGAAARYGIAQAFGNVPIIYCEKVRNQLTGQITGLKVVDNNIDISHTKILIVDDICDGGMTFIKVAEALHKFAPKQVDLAVSHGLFSKGKQCLHDAGISNIYTTNSLLRNPEGFRVW